MKSEADRIAGQYSRPRLFEHILEQFLLAGIPEDEITPGQLSAADQFHVGGIAATREIAQTAGLHPGMQVLDAGCGIGGPARCLAAEFGCQVTGLDITPEYIRTAILLSSMAGQSANTRFITGSATQMPFNSGEFDVVWTQHAQMNIADKRRLFSEISRVLKKHGRFVYYDILSVDHRPVHFPVPWANQASLSHLATSEEMHNLMAGAGLRLLSRSDKTEAGILFFEERLAGNLPPPPVNLAILMGEAHREKQFNVLKNLKEGNIVLESGIATRE